jgi:hypothetical protein
MSNVVTTALEWLADKSRAASLLVVSLILLAIVALVAPQQLGIVAYKGALLSAAAFGGYWVDRVLFANGRIVEEYPDAHAEYRRAIVVAACVLAGAFSA